MAYSGNVFDGLLLHPDNEHIIYPLGTTVVVRHILSRSQTFLRGHNHNISCTIQSIQQSRSPRMASISPAQSTPSPVRSQKFYFGISRKDKSSINSSFIRILLLVLHFLLILVFLPHRDALKISTFVFI